MNKKLLTKQNFILILIIIKFHIAMKDQNITRKKKDSQNNSHSYLKWRLLTKQTEKQNITKVVSILLLIWRNGKRNDSA